MASLLIEQVNDSYKYKTIAYCLDWQVNLLPSQREKYIFVAKTDA